MFAVLFVYKQLCMGSLEFLTIYPSIYLSIYLGINSCMMSEVWVQTMSKHLTLFHAATTVQIDTK